MRKYVRIKYSLIIVAVSIVAGAIVLACGDIGNGDADPNFFPVEVTHNTVYAQFFNTDITLYATNKQNNYPVDFESINIQEWRGYFKNYVKENDLEQILYKVKPGAIDTLIFSIKKPGYPVSENLKTNTIFKVKDTRATLDFLYYMGFAFRCEKYVTFVPDNWYDNGNRDTNDYRSDKAGMLRLAEAGLKQMTNTNSDFVKQRYVFQLLRLYYMSRNFDKCIQLYNEQKTLLEANANSMKYRAMGYAAGAYYGTKQFGTANYFYSVIYAGNEAMRQAAFFSFHPQEEEDWKQTLALAKNNREKAVLWQMVGLYQDPLRGIKEVYSLDPKSDLLDQLLADCMKTEESKFLPARENFDLSKLDSLSYYESQFVDTEFVAFVKSVADKGNTLNPYEWDLAAGYLEWASNGKGFQKYLDKVKLESPGDKLAWQEAKLIDMLDHVKIGKAGDRKFEDKLVPELEWLTDSTHPAYFPKDYAEQYILGELSAKYLAAGDSVKYWCLMGMEIEDERIITYMDKKDKTPFDLYIIKHYPFTRTDGIEVQANYLLYNFKFKEALAKLEEDSGAGLEQMDMLAFTAWFKDCHDCGDMNMDSTEVGDTNILVENLIVNNRRDFIRTMIILTDSVKKDPAHADQIYFLLANGYYNMTYFGEASSLYDTKATYMEYEGFYHDYSDTARSDFAFYEDCRTAEEYYNLAMNASKDPELKAKCCFLAAKCDHNYFYCHKPRDYQGDFKAGKYFALLKANYSKTQYYQEIIAECGYFRTYLGAK